MNPQPNLCALFSVSAINSRLTEDDLVAAASVTSVASSSSPAVLSMVEAAWSSNTIDAVAEAFFWGEEEAMTSIPHNLSTVHPIELGELAKRMQLMFTCSVGRKD